MAGTNPCVVLDNGGDTLKYGFCNENLPRVLRNCIGSFKNQPRRYLGEELTSLRNTSGILLSRPFERGVITNWSCQVELWSKAFEKLNLRNPLAFSDISLLLTAAPFLPDSVACDTTEIVFEQFGFGSYLMRPAAWFSAYEYTQDPLTSSSSSGRSVLVIDSGFSSTHVMPFINLQTRVDCVCSSSKPLNQTFIAVFIIN